MTRRVIVSFGRDYFERLHRHRATSVASELAYAFLFSLFPFLVFAVTALAYTPLSADDVMGFVVRYVPGPVAETIEDTVRGVLERRSGGVLSAGAVAALWAASRAANVALFAINQAHETSVERPFWKARLLALGITFLLVLSVLISFVFPVFGWVLRRFSSLFGLSSIFLVVWEVVRWFLSLLVLMLGFLIIYYLAPNASVRVREAIPGAALAAVGWQAVSYGFSFYLERFANYSAVYGSLGGVIALMVWFYLAGLILILGAELNAQLHCASPRHLGHTVTPRGEVSGGARADG
ncbi:MAG: YihY/virulence factor BrkB family protein [Deltaproteobacteria bacterium]|nr:YihY/virulence factor BrkB family protein [Deltaproteobacteria bacterium]